MQTYTHLAIGALVGTIAAPHDRVVQIASAVGSIAPDVMLVPKYFYDKVRGHQPFAHLSKGTVLFIEVLNSMPLWLGLGVISSLFMPSWAQSAHACFFVNVMLHLFIDRLTHSGKEFEETDPGGLWPLPMKLDIGIWEYRYAHGTLKPKPFEALVLIICLVVTFLVSEIIE